MNCEALGGATLDAPGELGTPAADGDWLDVLSVWAELCGDTVCAVVPPEEGATAPDCDELGTTLICTELCGRTVGVETTGLAVLAGLVGIKDWPDVEEGFVASLM